jgi:hypothetical protein
MSDKTYNGWTNYETRNVALWLDNDHHIERFWSAMAQECWNEATATSVWTREESATYALAELLKDDIAEENRPSLEGCYGDLLGADLSKVNWDEIAEHYVNDVQKDDDEEDEDDEEPEDEDKEEPDDESTD